jgi:GT2 family glycosyltransferase
MSFLNRKISIVMTYFERPKQLEKTLNSIQWHSSRSGKFPYETIIVDDGSRLFPLKDINFSKWHDLNINIITLEKNKYINPSIAYNHGFSFVTGDIVLIQNSECFHFSDILSFLSDNYETSTYVSFSCYSLNKFDSDLLCVPNEFPKFFINQSVQVDGETGWYNHSVFRPKYYHFASAISRENLVKLRGFDLRYKYGYGFDDDEFIFRIRREGIITLINNDLIVIHQWHSPSGSQKNIKKLWMRNYLFFNKVTIKEVPKRYMWNLCLITYFYFRWFIFQVLYFLKKE